MSDNGASAEGGARGSFNEAYFFNFVPESLEENLARIDDLGSPRAFNHYPWGWAWAGNTPLKRFKRDTHEGGVADPLIVHWPAQLRHDRRDPSSLRARHRPAANPARASSASTRRQRSTASSSHRSRACRLRRRSRPDVPNAHVTQYYEMLGSRALYHDGWKAVVYHPGVFTVYDGTDVTKPFDEDVWELYHVAADFAEVHDLAAAEPSQARRDEDAVVDRSGEVPSATAQQPARRRPRHALPPRAVHLLPRHWFDVGGRRAGAEEPPAHDAGRAERAGRRLGRRRDRRRTAAWRAATCCTSKTAGCTTPTTSSAPRSRRSRRVGRAAHRRVRRPC